LAGGYAGLDRIEDWNLDFMERSEKGQEYLSTARQVEQAIRFMVACGMTLDIPIMRETEFFVSHECLLLDYEQALTRQDSTTGGW
jgi:3-deoxy-7-phosphoheptulonate synthase